MPETKLKLEPTDLPAMSFYDAMRVFKLDGCDITDPVWDWGVYLAKPEALSLKSARDPYDKFLLILALNLQFDQYVPDWYSPCRVCEFIEANRQAFDKFLDEENQEGCRPSDYSEPLRSNEDEGYFEVYMQSMEGLIAGQYSEGGYAKLVKYLTEGVSGC